MNRRRALAFVALVLLLAGCASDPLWLFNLVHGWGGRGDQADDYYRDANVVVHNYKECVWERAWRIPYGNPAWHEMEQVCRAEFIDDCYKWYAVEQLCEGEQ